MAQSVVGGIRDNQDLQSFAAFPTDIVVKDQIDLMSRCWFSLATKRTEPIEHEYFDQKTGLTETVRITGGSELGIATIHDQDLVIFAISQWMEAKRLGMNPSRRINFTPYQFFNWIDRAPSGRAYQRIKEALHRLKTTNVETTISFDKNQRRNKKKQFSWISEWEIREENGKIRGIEIVLAEWLFESIQNFHVLTLDKKYFGISGSIERWLYLYARKATGGSSGAWKETIRSLHQKSASQQTYKHYASDLRKIVRKNNLPGLDLSLDEAKSGQEMLRMKRTEKRHEIEIKADNQLPLIEQSPAEEAWEAAQDILAARLGEAAAKAWITPLELRSFDDGVLRLTVRTKFHADYVESQFRPQIIESMTFLGLDIKTMLIEVTKTEQGAF